VFNPWRFRALQSSFSCSSLAYGSHRSIRASLGHHRHRTITIWWRRSQVGIFHHSKSSAPSVCNNHWIRLLLSSLFFLKMLKTESMNALRLQQDHPCVIEMIRKHFLIAPSPPNVSYVLTDPEQHKWPYPTDGQTALILRRLDYKVHPRLHVINHLIIIR